ncbi:sensor histidine kinase [Paenibacillus dakarensis]|uniref:sensor histidine kinase n=1 Tax=Paenibacillus dakarensis TaxID=1527293 RepID=UPI0006D56C55|nr:sensor histidine kinase [Paenibacillus dakarensis]
MKAVPKYFAVLIMIIVPVLLLQLLLPSIAAGNESYSLAPDWQVMWEWKKPDTITPEAVKESQDWQSIEGGLSKPEGAVSAWFRASLPHDVLNQPAILLGQVTGKDVIAFVEDEPLFESHRDYMYTKHRLLLSLAQEDMGKTLYIWIETPRGATGIEGFMSIGEYENLQGEFIQEDLDDFVMGSSFLFIALVMFFCCFFLPRHNVTTWISLSLVICASGILLITYSPFLYTFYSEYGELWLTLFDISMLVLVPALTFYFEKIYGTGPFGVIRYMKNFLFIYSMICLVFLFVNQLSGDRFYNAFYIISVSVLGIIVIIEMLILVGITIMYTIKRKKDAYIFSIGFSLLTAAAIGDLITFYTKNGHYYFFLWKWGVLALIISLIVMLGRKFVRSHEQVVRYSKELELFNNELQRSEKMEIISELAASVAHEVRNPLQVTRGFMQLLGERSNPSQQEYLDLALKELDRASAIITDFLTFAKPELEQVSKLNLPDELRHVAGILMPLANIGGGTIVLNAPETIHTLGNSSKLKQAMVNLVKNSIEALDGEGTVNIWAYKDKEQAIIHIRDDGVGMEAQELVRLGEPYYSNKTKGTGLGLMVTFRIIEAMKGTIEFTSQKGIGTEVIIRFPLAD